MKKLFLLSFVFLLCFKNPLQAQPSLGFYINGSAPFKQLCDSGYHNGIGFSMEFLTGSLIKTPKKHFEIKLGFGLEYFSYGTAQVKDLVFNTLNNDLGYVVMQNEMTGFYTATKFVYTAGRVSPYIDIFGARRKFYSTQTNTFNQPVDGYDPSTTTKLYSTSLWHYGYSVGLLYRVGRATYFDLRVSASKGGNMDFVKLASVEKGPAYQSNLKYHTVNTAGSDILIYRLGVVFKFGSNKNRNTNTGTTTPANYTSPSTPYTPPRNTTPPAQTKPAPQKNKPAEVKPVPKQAPPKPQN